MRRAAGGAVQGLGGTSRPRWGSLIPRCADFLRASLLGRWLVGSGVGGFLTWGGGLSGSTPASPPPPAKQGRRIVVDRHDRSAVAVSRKVIQKCFAHPAVAHCAVYGVFMVQRLLSHPSLEGRRGIGAAVRGMAYVLSPSALKRGGRSGEEVGLLYMLCPGRRPGAIHQEA